MADEMYAFVSRELKVRSVLREGPDDRPMAQARIKEVYGVSEQYGFEIVDEENMHEYVTDMTGLFLNAMMEVSKLSDCEVGAIVRNVAEEFIPRGC